MNESCIIVDYTGHSASVLRDSAITCENSFFKIWPPKDAKTKWTFHGVSRRFRTFKVPTKADGGKPSLIWGQNFETGLSAVSLRPCGPLALIPVNGKKRNRGHNLDRKMTAVRDPGVAGW